jgi:hypothetical protein
MPLNYLLRNRLKLNGHPHNINDTSLGNWEFWRFQMTIEDINKIKEEMNDTDSINSLSTLDLYKNQNN